MLQIDILLLFLEIWEAFGCHLLLVLLCLVIWALPFGGFTGYLFEFFFYLCLFERWLVISWPFWNRKILVNKACWSLGGDVIGLQLNILHDFLCWFLPNKICVLRVVLGQLNDGLEILGRINLNTLGLSRSILGKVRFRRFWLLYWFDGRNLGLNLDSFLGNWSCGSFILLGQLRSVGKLLSLWVIADEVLGGLFGHCDCSCFPYNRLCLNFFGLFALVDI